MPAGSNDDSIFFYGFQAGEYGTQDGSEVGWGLYRQHLYYKGWWTGQNVVRYVDGSLGPRSGLVALGVTGLPNGVLNGLGYAPVSGKSGWAVIGTALYRFDAETVGVGGTFVANLGASPTRPLTSVHVGGKTYITSYGDKTYCYDPTASTLTAITGSPGGSCITAYQDRLIVGCTSTAGSIIWYSDPAPADGSSFLWSSSTAASQYLYVGDQWEVRSLSALRTGLAISKQDGSWWVLTGTPGVNDVLRKVWAGLAVGPIWAHRTAVAPDGSVWGVPYGGDYPAFFTGAKAGNIKYLSFMAGTSTDDGAQHVDVGVAPVFQADELVAVSGNAGSPNTALLRRNGIFCKHLFGVNVTGWIAQGTLGRMLLSDGGAVGAPPVMYAWRASGIERPNVVGNNLESVGDASTTPLSATFSLPEWLERGGGQVTVAEVMVEFHEWNTNTTATNHIDMTVTATRRRTLPNATTPVPDKTSGTYSYDAAGSTVGATGAMKGRSYVFGVGDQGRGNGFQITFSNLRGVAIRRVMVKIKTEGATP